MTRKITILKLGGSLLTDKSKPYSLRKDKLNAVVREIKECIDLGLIEELVIIHGVGSYGHPPVLKYLLHRGFKSEDQLIHLSETQAIVNDYRNMIVKSFLEMEIPINLMHASSIVVGNKMRIVEYNFKPLTGFLALGMIPLIGGDMMFDETMGFSVCGGDQLAVIISYELKASHLIFATDVPGVYDKDPKKETKAILFKSININEIENVIKKIEEANKTDASGRMKGKLLSIMSTRDLRDLIEDGLKISIISMMEEGNLQKYLEGHEIDATKIVFE